MRVAVVGAGGFLGRALCSRLEVLGHSVVRLSSKSGDFEAGSGLLTTPRLPDGIDAGVYLAQSPHGRSGPERADHLWNVNVTSALRAHRLVAAAGGYRFLYASTGSVYAPAFAAHRESDPVDRSSAYPLSKIHAEEALALDAGDVDVSVLRLFGIFGAGQHARLFPRLCEAIRAERPVDLFPAAAGAQDRGLRLSLCHVDDAVDVIIALLPVLGLPRVNVAAPAPTTMYDLAREIGRNLGCPPHFSYAPEPRTCDLLADTSLLAGLRVHDFPPLADRIAMSCTELP
ncbi:MAG: NAD(P)-dependent oxidoreductase [Actinomycetota bacterium]|nr:NAD(P)-dependent oxidoreductase [Actinomycetota bacterium]